MKGITTIESVLRILSAGKDIDNKLLAAAKDSALPLALLLTGTKGGEEREKLRQILLSDMRAGRLMLVPTDEHPARFAVIGYHGATAEANIVDLPEDAAGIARGWREKGWEVVVIGGVVLSDGSLGRLLDSLQGPPEPTTADELNAAELSRAASPRWETVLHDGRSDDFAKAGDATKRRVIEGLKIPPEVIADSIRDANREPIRLEHLPANPRAVIIPCKVNEPEPIRPENWQPEPPRTFDPSQLPALPPVEVQSVRQGPIKVERTAGGGVVVSADVTARAMPGERFIADMDVVRTVDGYIGLVIDAARGIVLQGNGLTVELGPHGHLLLERVRFKDGGGPASFVEAKQLIINRYREVAKVAAQYGVQEGQRDPVQFEREYNSHPEAEAPAAPPGYIPCAACGDVATCTGEAGPLCDEHCAHDGAGEERCVMIVPRCDVCASANIGDVGVATMAYGVGKRHYCIDCNSYQIRYPDADKIERAVAKHLARNPPADPNAKHRGAVLICGEHKYIGRIETRMTGQSPSKAEADFFVFNDPARWPMDMSDLPEGVEVVMADDEPKPDTSGAPARQYWRDEVIDALNKSSAGEPERIVTVCNLCGHKSNAALQPVGSRCKQKFDGETEATDAECRGFYRLDIPESTMPGPGRD